MKIQKTKNNSRIIKDSNKKKEIPVLSNKVSVIGKWADSFLNKLREREREWESKVFTKADSTNSKVWTRFCPVKCFSRESVATWLNWFSSKSQRENNLKLIKLKLQKIKKNKQTSVTKGLLLAENR